MKQEQETHLQEPDLLSRAMELDAAAFKEYFEKHQPARAASHARLNEQNGTLEDYLANPLVFIVANVAFRFQNYSLGKERAATAVLSSAVR